MVWIILFHLVATLIFLSQNYLYHIRGHRSPLIWTANWDDTNASGETYQAIKSKLGYNEKATHSKKWPLELYLVLHSHSAAGYLVTYLGPYQPLCCRDQLKLLKCFVVDAEVILWLDFEDIYFCINKIIFRHLELKIALAIPSPNEWKIVRDNSAA